MIDPPAAPGRGPGGPGGPGGPLIDTYGRVHDDLRVSVTDRCNLRCRYCMPVEPEWFPKDRILSYEELARVVAVAARAGVRKVRITGGEPLVRRDLPAFVRAVAGIPGIVDVSLTTNGVRLEGAAAELAAAGLRRVNVSLDTLDPDRFERMTRRPALDAVLRGLDAAARAGLLPVKVNAVLMRGENDDEIEAFVDTARRRGWELRFIEFMPLENGETWDRGRVVTGDEVRRRIAARWPIEPDGGDRGAPARRYRFVDGAGVLGFVDSVSAPFCRDCGRLRLTADGRLRVCLYDDRETDLASLVRGGADDAAIERAMHDAVAAKGRGGALDIAERVADAGPRVPAIGKPARTMHQIGG